MQDSCPPPGPPPALDSWGAGLSYVTSLGQLRNYAALHPWLKVHWITSTTVASAPRFPHLTEPHEKIVLQGVDPETRQIEGEPPAMERPSGRGGGNARSPGDPFLIQVGLLCR